MSGWKGVKGCWPAILVCGGSFAAIQLAASNLHGPTLVSCRRRRLALGDDASAAILAPAEVWRFSGENPAARTPDISPLRCTANCLRMDALDVADGDHLRVGLAGVEDELDEVSQRLPLENAASGRAGLSQCAGGVSAAGRRPRRHRGAGHLRFQLAVPTGTGIFLASILTADLAADRPGRISPQFPDTLYRVRWAVATIACMLALAFTTKYSGADATLGWRSREPAGSIRCLRRCWVGWAWP